DPLLPLIAGVPQGIPGTPGVSRPDRPNDKQDQSDNEQECYDRQQQTEQPECQDNAQREDQRKCYRDDMREKPYPSAIGLISIPHQCLLFRNCEAMHCMLSRISWIHDNHLVIKAGSIKKFIL